MQTLKDSRRSKGPRRPHLPNNLLDLARASSIPLLENTLLLLHHRPLETILFLLERQPVQSLHPRNSSTHPAESLFWMKTSLDPARAPREMERPAPTPLQAQQAVLDKKDLPIPQSTSPEEGDDSFLLGNTGAGKHVEAGSEANITVPTPPDMVSENDLLRDLEKDDDENDSIPDSGIDTDNAVADNAFGLLEIESNPGSTGPSLLHAWL
ncbi:hypothetical protein BT96DRAFT_944661 [Gymnopus androsaceus JB14]|uniref:Uncharacterized protein n=1 Tax=Gymnopus androsaceus JB14 TaxID=1447944 RepID=A0A6A4H2I2_9AGAR|nr:hypothetical protein BT96DRAFT_944661 [Gymnopus androsaceus JB14]